MFTVINNTTMEPIATVDDMDIAVAWAETIPYQNDFSIIRHISFDLAPYSTEELRTLYQNLVRFPQNTQRITRTFIIGLLDNQVTTSDMPPDEKRVAPIPNEVIEMATRKKVTKKTAVRKPPVKKTPVKKTPVKKTPVTKVERTSKNGVLTPKPGSQTGKVFDICDALSKKAGEPAKRIDVIAAGEKAGVKAGTVTAAYQIWRKYHGLVKAGK